MWWIVHDDWKPYSFRDGVLFFADGCRWRLTAMDNAREDSNGKLSWRGSDLVLKVDNRRDKDRIFKYLDGKWVEGSKGH